MDKNKNLFVYGSLMHPDEMEEMFGKNIKYLKAKLDGYVRDFSKKSYSWGKEDEIVGVLGLQKSDEEWCNGLVIKNIDEEKLNKYYLRETGMSISEYRENDSGYKIKEINIDRFDVGIDNNTNCVTTSVISERLEKPNTDEEYLNLCYKAAKKHGDEFYNNFKNSTYEYYQNV